ncbi:3-deoxy-7-phosphoheptulonate synthase [Candidatus Borkfalkia ceftriaxoniphila]|uniref:Phospho-2-dehydro-3-deoxyheptonate aldolase n=1 Tax=Candidatus Borkfalkia ceftriaxoniphila TaxID=2508949 RepID=A0A4Q2K566_9FIRM|nr:3-deoxy-7-phosphoheptulonate synthase [Candidatus Borkfalkia ceftriaxoniphila]RXZ58082.1 3-deoxy-7-phosphoheptulonate synthase [Candidatus Borkfalkia ceftriaxoniphila]
MFRREERIPEAEEIIAETPLPENLRKIKRGRDELAGEVIRGDTDKLLLIIGPCSAHESRPVLDYVEKLGKLNERVKDKIVIVPRIYTNKPRTKGVGYKGMFTQPDPNGKEDILKGIKTLRQLHIDAIGISGLSAADEMLYPENYAYVEDLLTYIAVGARSSENQMHRLVSSGIELPVGIKNPMSGSIPVLLNSIYAAQSEQIFKYQNYQVKTTGNELAHAVLRGAVDNYGNDIPNFHYEFVMKVIEGYSKSGLKHPAIVIDANHSNSGKKHRQQIRIVEEVLNNRLYDKDFKKYVKGFMIESFLEEGCQREDIVYGKSITDPCLGWEDTERLVLDIADKV